MPDRNTTQVVCVAEFFAREGKTEELIDALHVLMKPTHAEPGCIRYELNQRTDQPNGITFIEKWKDKKVFDEHCAMPYITNFFDNVRPGLVDRFEVKLYEEILPYSPGRRGRSRGPASRSWPRRGSRRRSP